MTDHIRKIGKVQRVLRSTVTTLLVLLAVLGIWQFRVNFNPVAGISMPPPPPPAPSPNAYDFYLKAVAASSAIHQKRAAKAMYNPGEFGNYTRAEKDAVLAAGAQIEPLLCQGFAYPCQAPTLRRPRSSFYASGNDYGNFRQLARYLYFASRVEAERGNWDDAISTSLNCLRFSHDLTRRSTTTGLLYSVALQSSCGRPIIWKSVNHLNGKDARAAVTRLEEILAREPVLCDALLEEKYQQQLTLLRLFQQKDWRWQVCGSFSFRDLLDSEQLKLDLASKHEIIEKYTRHMDAIITRSKLPFAEACSLPPIPPPRLYGIPHFEGTRHKYLMNQVENNLLLVTLALHTYFAEHDHYPSSLSMLTSSYLRKIPGDPFASDGKLHYRILGKRYLLYSVGPDGADNDGKPLTDMNSSTDSEGDVVAGINLR